ncbi:hypothetical protein HDU76_004268, partial [Blyttiomyces sp. JEL0837]
SNQHEFPQRFFLLFKYAEILLDPYVFNQLDFYEMFQIEDNESNSLLDRMQAIRNANMFFFREKDYDAIVFREFKILQLCKVIRKDENLMEEKMLTYPMSSDYELIGHEKKSRKQAFFATVERPLKDLRNSLNDLWKVDPGRNVSRLFKYALDNPVSQLTRCACCKAMVVVPAGEGRFEPDGFPLKVDDWKKGGHKEECRRPGEFRYGDLVMLKGLKTNLEVNGSMGVVFNMVSSQDEAVKYSVFNFIQKEKGLVYAQNMALKAPNSMQGLLMLG